MTKHYKDEDGKVYGYKPKGVSAVEITVEEAREITFVPETIEQKIAEIDAQLEEIDSKSKRPMRAILTANEGDDTSEDLAYLSELESQAAALRTQRAGLVE